MSEIVTPSALSRRAIYKKSNAKRYLQNPDYFKSRAVTWSKNNPEKRNKIHQKWWKENPEKNRNRKTDFSAPTALAQARPWHSFVSVPLRGPGCPRPTYGLGSSRQGFRAHGAHYAAHPAAHAGDLACAGRRQSMASSGCPWDDRQDARSNLWAPSSGLAKGRRRGVIRAILCQNRKLSNSFKPGILPGQIDAPQQVPILSQFIASNRPEQVANTRLYLCPIRAIEGGHPMTRDPALREQLTALEVHKSQEVRKAAGLMRRMLDLADRQDDLPAPLKRLWLDYAAMLRDALAGVGKP